MNQCWSEGEIRAYLDGELPPRDMTRLAEHLAECVECAAVESDLAARRDRISALLEVIPEPEMVVPLPKLPARSGIGRGITTAIVALAAAAAIAFFLLPRRTEKPVVQALPPPRVAPTPAPAPPPAPVTVKPAVIRRLVPRKKAAPAKPQVQDYVALDNEPIETGVVVRVGLEEGRLPADVIFGPDGRARAIRLVNYSSGDR